ncbi:MAG: histidine--tRNA ligase [Candidatus Gastranaerophilales bacterium]|nr:histidine--tRNA ligase [Candidatus Gastranaerophilales bacterium]
MIKAQRGTKDILGDEIPTWQWILDNAKRIFQNACFQEIKTPIFEATELFARGVGDSTDIVNKEMYSFCVGGALKDSTSITLRPENTAGVVRAFIEHNLNRQSPPQKFWYFGPMFRYERPQAGRQRQFHQLGVEMFGIKEPSADAEVILSAVEFLKSIGLGDLEVELNSLGCNKCKNDYRNSIKEVLKPYLDELCDDCKMRYEKNPLRILDCKNEECQKIFELPEVKKVILADYICGDCREHFETLLEYLDELGIKYSRNKLLVRGLDYYNRTVFEIKSQNLGSQSAVCGGGRYDGLVEMLGGVPTPAIGFAMGVERLYTIVNKIEQNKTDYFVVSQNTKEALKLARKLREDNKTADFDMQGRKWVKQLEKASKVAKYAILLGEDEINQGFYSVKNLSTGEQVKINNLKELC